MWNRVVSLFDVVAGRMIAGVLNLSSAHPVAMVLILAVLAALVCTTWLDLIGVRFDEPWWRPEQAGDPGRARRGATAEGPDSTATPPAR
jgi:hypothetical protein